MTTNQNHTLSPEEASTFRSEPQRKILTVGTQLYRFVTLGQNTMLGEYWLDRASIKSMKDFAGGNNSRLVEIARSWSAVKHEWNRKMSHIVKIRIVNDCFAWEGPARFQSISGNSNVLFMGNSNQLFIPNLTENEAKIISLTQLTN